MTDLFLGREKITNRKDFQLLMRSANVSEIIIKRLPLTVDIIDESRYSQLFRSSIFIDF